MSAAALYVLTLAKIYGIPVEDIDRKRALIMAVMAGDAGASAVKQTAGRTGPHWARLLVKGVDPKTLRAINKVLGRNFVTKYGRKQGILVLGKAAPLGIGAGIGAAGNAGFGYLTVRTARKAFGPCPAAWCLEQDT